MELCSRETRAEYEKFVETHPKGHFMQMPVWGELKSSWKWEGIIVRGEDGKIKGVMSVLIRRMPVFGANLMYSPRGPVCDLHDGEILNELTQAARELARRYKAYVLKMDTDVPSDDGEYESIMLKNGYKLKNASKNFEGIQPRFVFRLYLNGRGEDELMASFHQKTRYNIRVALKNNVEVRIVGKEELDTFHALMLQTGVRDGFVIRSKQYFSDMLDALGEHARLYMAYHDGEAIAGTLAIWLGDKVWYLYGASSNEHRNLMPNYLLQFEMIKWAIEKGCRIYDFRGVSGNLDPDSSLYGLYRFKKGFNGEFTEFIGEMELIFSPFMNGLINRAERMYRSSRRLVFLIKNRGRK